MTSIKKPRKSSKDFIARIMTNERETKAAANKVLRTFIPKLKEQLKPADYCVKMTDDFDEVPAWINPNPAHCFIRHNTDQFMSERSKFVIAKAMQDKSLEGSSVDLMTPHRASNGRKIYCNGNGDMTPLEGVDDFSWATFYVKNLAGRIKAFIDEAIPLIAHAVNNIDGNGDHDKLIEEIEALASAAEQMASKVRDAGNGVHIGPPMMGGTKITNQTEYSLGPVK